MLFAISQVATLGIALNPGHGHHWYGDAESYFLIGDALSEGMKKLLFDDEPIQHKGRNP